MRNGHTRSIRTRQRSQADEFLSPANPGEDFLSGVEWIAVANVLSLTAKEMVVAALLLSGRTRKAMARHLSVSPETVRVHIDRLFQKFRVRDRLGLGLRIARIRQMIQASGIESAEKQDYTKM